MKKIEDNIKDILCTILKVPRKKIDSSFSYKSSKKWDSLNHVKIIMALESNFKIKIKADLAVEMMTYKKIIQNVKKIV
jgi:acyl carrier protein